jgi:hypothetical protein
MKKSKDRMLPEMPHEEPVYISDALEEMRKARTELASKPI